MVSYPLLSFLSRARQRWELEVVQREDKSRFGQGDKQCLQPHAAVLSVQWSAWCYALLTFAPFRTFGLPTPPALTSAWYPHPLRCTFSTLLDVLRADLWGHPTFSQFLSPSPKNSQKLEPLLLDFFSHARPFNSFPT